MKAKKFLIYKQNKMLKVKNFIKNTPFRLYHTQQRRDILRGLSNI